MRIAGRRIVPFSFGVGVLATFVAMLIPTVSDTVVSWVANIRDKISGKE